MVTCDTDDADTAVDDAVGERRRGERSVSAAEKLVILDPTSGPKSGAATMVSRTEMSLEGAKVALLWNGRVHGDKVLRALAQRLNERWGVTVVNLFKKKFIGNVAPPEYFQGLIELQPNFVIAGVGD